MLVANGYEYSVEIHEKELRLSAKMFGDKNSIDPVIDFTDIMGFDAGKASGYNYVHIRTWNSNGHTNFDMWGTGFFSSLKNRNYIIFHRMFQKPAFKLLCEELTRIVDENQALINERFKTDSEYRELLRAELQQYRQYEQQKPKTFYGIWIDWN
jgi:hypothetical protein